jgi:hypothetical protein
MKLAFLILTHNQIELVYRQIDALSHPDHHFFIHPDKKYKLNIKDEYTNNRQVHFTVNRIRVNWGGFSIVRATLNLIREALASGIKFDYFILASDHCFPIKPSCDIRSFLKRNNGFSFIEIYPLPYEKLKEKGLNELGLEKYHYPVFFDQLSFIRKGSFSFGHKIYHPKKLLFRILTFLLRTMGYKRKIPSNLVPCFGSQWWVLHSDAVNYVIKYIEQNPKVFNLFKYTWAPDELFFHSILYSSPLANNIRLISLWYIDWSANGPPKTLDYDDIDALLQSEALLARKFDVNKSLNLIHRLEHFWNPLEKFNSILK